jgi:hypothetical protein
MWLLILTFLYKLKKKWWSPSNRICYKHRIRWRSMMNWTIFWGGRYGVFENATIQRIYFRPNALKLTSKYYGPFLILERIGKLAYKLQLPTGASYCCFLLVLNYIMFSMSIN